MLMALKKKKKSKSILIRQMRNIRPFELGGVVAGANRERDWVVCKEDFMKIDEAKLNRAISTMQEVATVLKSGEPAADVMAVLQTKLSQAMQEMAMQGFSLDGIDRDAMRSNLEAVNARISSVGKREHSVELLDEIDGIEEAIKSMLTQLSGEKLEASKKKSDHAPVAEKPNVEAAKTVIEESKEASKGEPLSPEPKADPEAPNAPVVGETVTGDAPQPVTPPPADTTQTPAPDGLQDGMVTKADLQAFSTQVSDMMKKLGEGFTGMVNKLQQDVTGLQQGMATVNKQLDPGAIPGVTSPVVKGDDGSNEDDFPSDMGSLVSKYSDDDLGIGSIRG